MADREFDDAACVTWTHSRAAAYGRDHVFTNGTLARISADSTQDQPPPPAKDPGTSKGAAGLLNDVAVVVRGAIARVGTIQDPQKARHQRQELALLVQQFGGTDAVLKQLQSVDPANPHSGRQIEQYRQQIGSAERLMRVLSAVPSDTHRQSAYRLAQQAFGLRGVLALAQEESERFSYQNGNASVDAATLSVTGKSPGPYPNDSRKYGWRWSGLK